MAWHRLVHRQIANHEIVVFAKERFLSFFRPVFWRWRNREKCFAIFVEWAGRITIGNGDTALEFRHRDHVQRNARSGNQVVLFYEIGRFTKNFLRVRDDSSVVGVLLSEFVENCDRHLMFVRESCRVCVGKRFFVER